MQETLMSTAASPLATTPFTCSIVFEWENWHFCEGWRPESALAQLRIQTEEVLTQPHPDPASREGAFLARLRGPIEVVMAIDPTEVDFPGIRSLVERELGDSPHVEVVWEEVTPGSRYYETKNQGARRASKDVIVFTDSDVVPEPHWLRNLLGGLSHPEAALVTGMTFVTQRDFLDKVFALTWIIPVPTAPTPMHPHPNFQANNFAIRRELFQRYYFPDQPERERGQCVHLAKQLQQAGFPIYRENSAVTGHPRPMGLGNIVARALAAGTEVGYFLGPKPPMWKVLPYAAYGTAKRLAWAARNIVRDGHHVKLAWWEVPAALAAASMFHGLFGVGMIAGRLAPRAFRRHVRI